MIARITLILAMLVSTTDVSSCDCCVGIDAEMSDATPVEQSCPNCETPARDSRPIQDHVDRCCCLDVAGTLPEDSARLITVDSRPVIADSFSPCRPRVRDRVDSIVTAPTIDTRLLQGGRALLLLRTHRMLI